jgi:4-amino-4-deoxy-L-arabinose transferase-like glycosyltransferase
MLKTEQIQVIISKFKDPTLWLLFSLSAIILLWKLGQRSLEDWDEAIYAQISKEIVQNGNWITLHYGYVPWFHKPPLFIWSTAALFQCFGVNEFWARAASALSGVALILVTYLIGKKVYGYWVGVFASLILLASYQFVYSARFGTTDMMLTFFLFLSLYGYLHLRQGNQKWWYFIGTACALGFMVKGFAAIVAPAAIMITLLIERQLLTTFKSKHFWLSVVLATLIILPWHLMVLLQHGQAFLGKYLGYHVIERATRPLEGNAGDFFSYFQTVIKFFFPWVYLIPFAFIVSVKDTLKPHSSSKILIVFFLVVFGLYSLVSTKLSWYILPLYPIFAIFIGYLFKQAQDSSSTRSWILISIATVALVIFPLTPLKIVGIISPSVKQIVAVFCFVIVATLLVLILLKRLTPKSATILLFAVFVLSGIREVRGLYTARVTPLSALAQVAGQQDFGKKTPLIIAKLSADLNHPSASFYSNRPIWWIRSAEELKTAVNNERNHNIIMSKEDFDDLSSDYQIKVLSEKSNLVYATIHPKSFPKIGK